MRAEDARDAVDLRQRFLGALEEAERSDDPGRRAELTFVVVGGGPTGVEIAGELAIIVRDDEAPVPSRSTPATRK